MSAELFEEIRDLKFKNTQLQENNKAVVDRYRDFKTNFGIREKQGGVIQIDYEKFVDALGLEGCLELVKVIYEIHKLKGGPGEKPRMKVVAKA